MAKHLTGAAAAAIILAAAALLSCGEKAADVGPAGTEVANDELTYKIYGTVISARWPNPPIPGARIDFWDASNWPNPPEYLGRAIKEDDGTYEFPMNEQRLGHILQYRARASGYYDKWDEFQYYPAHYQLDIALEPNPFPPPGEKPQP